MLQHHLEEGRLAFDLLEQALPLGLGPAAVGEVVHEQAPAFVQELERPGVLVQQLLGQAAVQATCPQAADDLRLARQSGLRLGQPLISGSKLLGRHGGYGGRFPELGPMVFS
jgi:hypothetical protein